MSAAEMGLDEFLNYKSKVFDSDGEFLRWRDPKKPSQVDVWLHTKASFVQLFRHPFKKLVTVEDDGERTKKVYSQRIVSIEPLEVLKKQGQRNRDGSRKHPPTICPMSLLIEEVRAMIAEGDLRLEDPLFEFEADEETVVIHAGGFCGMLRKDKLSDEEKKGLKKAGVKLSEAWRENAVAKSEWIFRVVDNESPGDGVQIAFEKELLGQKLQSLIAHEVESMGRNGNPLVNPYCIRWKSDPSQTEFQKMYDALILRNEELSEEVRVLIEDEDPPGVSRFLEPPNYLTLRNQMEAQCAAKGIDWDKVFGPVLERCDESGNYEGGDSDESEKKTERKSSRGASSSKKDEAEDEEAKQEPAKKTRRQKAGGRRKKEEKQAPIVKLDPCDECGAELTTEHAKGIGGGQIEIVCPKCGAKFTDDAPHAARSGGDDEIPF